MTSRYLRELGKGLVWSLAGGVGYGAWKCCTTPKTSTISFWRSGSLLAEVVWYPDKLAAEERSVLAKLDKANNMVMELRGGNGVHIALVGGDVDLSEVNLRQ